jgi:benzoylformate decarboxylase
MPAAAGLRMAKPRRPIVAVVGDGSAVYGVPVTWSAAYYRIGVLFVVLSNGRYAVMDRLVERHGGEGPWPAFAEVEIATVARGFGCPARRISTHEQLVEALDEVVPALPDRDEPLLLDVAIAPTQSFVP